ncbi:MAG: DUF1329 domain-containing protein [Deltaproteobacteria bacterium]|nr:DUF1329 domain-containing protein [Deltaproteobacteria bacterium]
MIKKISTKPLLSLFSTAALLAYAALSADRTSADADEIRADNWTETVSFKPDVSSVQAELGKTVDKKNFEKLSPLLPKGMQLLIKKYNLKLGLTAYQPVHPSPGYIQATNKYRGKAKTVDTGKAYDKPGITGYVAGLPFPKPKSGLEVAWNFTYAYRADDGEVIYSVYWVSAGSGQENTEEWRLSAIKAMHRTDIGSIPTIESLASKGLQGAGLTYALSPYDKKGFGAVYFRPVEPKDSQGHIYVPSMRRILKNSFGTRGDSWNSTDLFYEDVRGYSGYPEWMYWKLVGQKTLLLPMHSGVQLGPNRVKSAYDFDSWPYWNPKFNYEPRPVYLLEVRPKLRDYPYSKQFLAVDAETFHVLYKEAYDKKGELWKIMINSGGYHPDQKTGKQMLGWSGTVVIDVQAEHATIFHVHKARVNVGLNPEIFSLSSLRKRSR